MSFIVFLFFLTTSCGQDKKPNSAAFIPFMDQVNSDPNQQVSEYIRRMHHDRRGNIWFGTNGDGVACYDPSKAGTDELLTYFNNENGFAGSAVRGIVEDKDGNLWFGTEQGLSKYDGKKIVNFKQKEGLTNTDIWALYLDSKNIIWIGTTGGVFQLDLKSETISKFAFTMPEVKNPSSRFSPKLIWCFMEDQDGHIWFGSDGSGISRFNPNANGTNGSSYTHFTQEDGLVNNNVISMLEDHSDTDRKGNIWFGTREGGLSIYDPKTNKFEDFGAKHALPGIFVHTIIQTHFDNQFKDNIWFSVLSGGICRYDGSTLTIYDKEDGLSNIYAQSILQDNTGRIWVGTGAGLFLFDGERFRNFTRNDFKGLK